MRSYVHQAGKEIINPSVDLACEQRSCGHRVAVTSAGGEYVGLLAEHRGHASLAGIRRPKSLPATGRSLRRLVRGGRFDIVHVRMNYATLVASLAVARNTGSAGGDGADCVQAEASLAALADRGVMRSCCVIADCLAPARNRRSGPVPREPAVAQGAMS